MNRSIFESNLENVLQRINADYISLNEAEVKQNKAIVETVLSMVINQLKQDALFKAMYNRVFYGGSFYDGLRVAEPNEFDLDLLLKLDKAQPTVAITNIPAFVKCKLGDPDAISGLARLVDGSGYVRNDKVRQWMEGLMTKAVNNLCPNGTLFVNGTTFRVWMIKAGPAVTLKLSSSEVYMDIDFVPCFVFRENQWPVGGYRRNTSSRKTDFFIVPKMPKNDLPCDKTILWRLSFQEQEREILAGKQFLKPTVKLLKKFRDVYQHKDVASYYIKTIFLWEATSSTSCCLNSTAPLTRVFLTMFEKYIEWLDLGEIPYFWNKKHNLLGVSPITLKNFANCLKYIHRDIINNLNDPNIIRKHLRIQIHGQSVTAEANQDESNSWCLIL